MSDVLSLSIMIVGKPESTVTRSFRVSERALKIIEADSAREGVTVNTFVNQLFTKYARIQRFLAKERWFWFPEPVLKDLFASFAEEKVAELGRKHGKAMGFQSLVLAMTGGSSVGHVIEFLKMVCDVNSLNYTEVEDGRRRTFIINHDVNRQFSIFLDKVFSTAFENSGAWPKVVSDERVVVFELQT